MTDPRNGLEDRLTEALREGSQGAPDAIGLAAAARSRAGQKRRARVAGAAAAVALAVAVPVAVVAWPGSDAGRGGGDHQDVADTSPDDSAGYDGYRWESWHGVTLRVPDSWGYGSLSDWCADGGEIGAPRVQRPGTVANSILCQPGSTYGLTFEKIDNHDDFEWPVVSQTGDSWPQPNYVGGRGIGGVLVMVATPDAEVAHRVLDSMRRITDTGDPNGCPARLTPGAATPPEQGLSVCRYDETWALDQSEVLFGQDAGEAVQALQAAPAAGASGCTDTSQGSQPHQVVVLEGAGITAQVDFVTGCPRVTVDGEVRELTSNVVYWALSPGWTGSVDGDVPLPEELRQR
jgi:hypothetical protein